jgi:hypothetical protein
VSWVTPRSFQPYLYPYPQKPIPQAAGTGSGGYGLRVWRVWRMGMYLMLQILHILLCKSPPGLWLQSPLYWHWSSDPDIYSLSLGQIPGGVEVLRWQRIASVRQAPTARHCAAIYRLMLSFSNRACCKKYKGSVSCNF